MSLFFIVICIILYIRTKILTTFSFKDCGKVYSHQLCTRQSIVLTIYFKVEHQSQNFNKKKSSPLKIIRL